ncbi:hypothetical protein ACIQPQ_34440 [Streptomyces sp. NPDC091281]|uniref:hypothetical protein n=1 Tax=Streptomyces sp. NPDC091281 TaxID=3365985 RepID=UPI003801825D
MSDEFERETQNLGVTLLAVYALLRRVCTLLPIPITLPDFEDGVLHGQEMTDAAARVVELVEDEPLDEELQAGVWGAALHWLGAAHLFTRYTVTHEKVVALEIRLIIVTAHDALHEVEDALLRGRTGD